MCFSLALPDRHVRFLCGEAPDSACLLQYVPTDFLAWPQPIFLPWFSHLGPIINIIICCQVCTRSTCRSLRSNMFGQVSVAWLKLRRAMSRRGTVGHWKRVGHWKHVVSRVCIRDDIGALSHGHPKQTEGMHMFGFRTNHP